MSGHPLNILHASSRLLLVITCLVLAAMPISAEAQATPPADGLTHLGKIQPRHAREIESSNWSVGAETMDRDFTIYNNWKDYLGPLGVKKARIQSGWAKTEKARGKYDWAWLDEIILDMVDQGVEPWVCLSYGNPVYPEGGGTGLGGGIPTSPEALAGWDRFVAAMVDRYKDQVDEWEIWNEPGLRRNNAVATYANLLIRTAEVIRKHQPNARIIAFAMAGIKLDWVDSVLAYVKEKDKLHLIDTLSYHPYSYNPDDRDEHTAKLRSLVASYSNTITLFQGENGAPSRRGSFGALAKHDWTEESQAKWALRRLLADLGTGIPSSYFSICDMEYTSRRNYKGLLAINSDKTVHHLKPAYKAIQHLTALFDNTVTRRPDLSVAVEEGQAKRYSTSAYTAQDGSPLVTLWRSSDVPGVKPEFESVSLAVKAAFDSPVWIDLRTGNVFALSAELWKSDSGKTTFARLPVYDSPTVVAERSAIADRLAPENAISPCLRLSGQVSIANTVSLPSVALAANDLASDFGKLLGTPPKLTTDGAAQIVISKDKSIAAREGYRIAIDKQGVQIAGADELGIIYGIYAFCEQYLGVDPYWYVKDLIPEQRDSIELPCGTLQSKPATFRYRGWFVNDEDLLTEWKNGGGTRHIDYPFYQQVVHIDVIDRVFEALLRAGGNLVIPASFVDVMNEPEARLVQRAVERGLYVTQHHIEPLGVSHYGFENYWKAKGKTYEFAYGSHPDQVREVWQAFAERWHDLAGDKVVWQLGLRGKADRAIWLSDMSVSQADAGGFISRAIAEQWKIVRSVDPRPNPPATTTLWHEGSQLMSKGVLTFPDEVTIVFADEGRSQMMQDDFHETPRSPDRDYGVYYHIGFWNTGAHLLQGAKPGRIRNEFAKVIAKGDTEYAIINVCNVREHVLGIQVATEIMNVGDAWSEPAFWDRFAPPILHGDYEELLANLVPIGSDRIMQDGALFAAAKKMLASYSKGKRHHKVISPSSVAERKRQLADSIQRLDTLAERYPSDCLTPTQRPFYDIHLLTQARMWREAYAFYLAVIEAEEEPERLKDAAAALERLLEVRKAAATGKWQNWYRGDKKVNVPEFLKRTQSAHAKLTSS